MLEEKLIKLEETYILFSGGGGSQHKDILVSLKGKVLNMMKSLFYWKKNFID